MNNNEKNSTTPQPPKPIADIVILHRLGVLDAFFETEDLYDRFMAEAAGYGEVEHLDIFVRLHVAPTFEISAVKTFLERPLSNEHL